MKTKFYLNLKSWLLMMLMLIGAGGNAWGDEISFIFTGENPNCTSVSGIVSGINYNTGKTGSASATAYNTTNGLVLYGVSNGGGFFNTTTPIGGSITNISITTNKRKNTPKYSVYGSKNGTDWTQIGSQTTGGTTENFSTTEGYSYIKVANTTAATAQLGINSIVITYARSTYTITAQSNNTSYGIVSLSGSVITGSPETGCRYAEPAYTVSPANSATVVQNGNAFTVTPSANTTVTINFEAIPTYTVTLGDDNSTLREEIGNAGVTLPIRSALNGYDFAGWSATNVATETTTAPTIIPAGAYAPTADITLYPVYTKTEGGGGEENKSASVTISDYASANNWTNEGQYSVVTLDANVTATGTTNGTNSKYYTNGTNWRFYASTNPAGAVKISTTSGTLSSVKLTYSQGAFKYGDDDITSGTPVNVSGTSAEFTCTTNARITAIEVNYTISGGGATYYWSTPVAAVVERPEIVVAENPFLFSTTATITCATDGAAIKYSFDGETWNDYSSALTITETKTIYAKAIKGENESDVAQVTATKDLATPSVTISGDLTLDLEGKTDVNAGTLTAAVTYNDAAVEGATVTWSSSNPDVATIDASTGVVTIKTRGNVTFTATYAANTDYAEATGTNTITVIDSKAPGSMANPYTVAQALEADVESGVYVKGIVSAVTEVSTQYHNVTYKISDDGTTSSDQFIVYRGKNVDNSNITSEDDVQVGDVVVVYGNIAEYQGVNQLAQGNYIISLTRPVYEITAKSNNEDLGTVSLEGNIITATLKDGSRYADPAFTVDAEGEVTVEQDGNEFVVVAKSNCTVTINFEAIPTHKVTWSINGETSEETVAEGAALTHAAPEAIEGKTFVGWVTEAIDGETDEAPTFVTSATMGTADVTYYAVFASQEGSGDPTWTETALSALTASDTFVIVGNGYAMPHNNGTSSAPTATAVTIDDSNLTSTVTDNIKWNVSGNTTDGYTFYPNGDDKKWLYCNTEAASGSNNNMRVGTGDRKVFELDSDGYLVTKDTYTTRYLSLYNNQDFRGYVTKSNGAFVPAFYKYSSNISYSGYCTTVDVPIRISTVEELKAFRDAVNTADKTVTSKNVLLVADLDLSGEENWTPIGNLVAYPGQSFDGVFDGNGHTIKNVTVVDNTPNHAVAGLFGSVVNGTIKNLTVENVNLTSSHYAGGIVAYTSNKPIIENCHVIGGTITSVPEKLGDEYDNGDKVGGIFGYATAGSTINNCTVDGLTIKAYRDMGGIVGFSAGNVTNNTVKNTTIIQSDVNAYKNEEITTYDYIVGRNGGATLENNVYEELNNVLTIDGAVAKIGDKLYRKLQAAVDAAEAGQTIDIVDDFTLTTVTTSPSDKYNVNVNKSVTINGNGHVITSAQGKRAIVLKGEGLDVTIKDLTIKNNKAEACLWIASNLTCTLDNTVLDGTNGKSYNQPLTIGSISNEGRVTLNVTNGSVIKTNDAGTAHYAIIASHPADITVTKSKLIGWGNVYLKPDAAGSTVKIEGSEMKSQGLSGSSNNFSILVTEGGNNTIEVKDTKITSSAVEGTYESLITLGGEGNVVKLLGETTYETNDKTWGAITYNWGSLKNNKLYLDDTTKAAFAEYLDGSHQETIEPADETGLYPVSFEPEVLYYWAVGDSYQGGYYSFADPFKNGWLADGEFIALQKNITLTEDITCQLASGTSFNFLLGDFTADKNGHSVALNTGVTVLTDKQTDIFKAAEAGYVIVETETETGYSYTAEKVMLAQPIIFHDGGEYEGALTVAIAGEGVKYTLNGGAEQTYSAPFTISETTTVKAWAEKDGVKSNEVEKTFTIVAKQAGAEVADGYYNIKTNDGKFVNVAGRKTVTLVSDNEGKAGTVIRVKADAEGVKVLRSQGVDLPGYAKKAMNYVPEIVQLAVDKLHAEGAGELLGETGLKKIMDKFNESFDYNLYLEKDGEAYRIYGRTPSMKPVVDFYAENKANVDAKLPKLEQFINSAIQKVLQKTNGSGASVLVPFSLQTIWERMGSTLTNPADDEAKFYEEVLSSEANVWNFAYQTAMLYWGNLKNHPRFAEIQDKLGDYSKYIDKVENIRPNFRYYIVPSASGVDFISQGNSMITDASTAWTMEPVSEFKVEIPETNKVGDKYYTTLYTDFAYTLPEGVKAMKVTSIGESGCYGYAETKEIDAQSIAEQTPILLVSETAGSKALELSKTGSAVTDNLLKGPDYLISEYKIKTPQVESLFDMAKSILGESAYETYLKKYEHLMLKNAGTVGNKYFFGLSKDECKEVDVNVCVLENVAEFGTIFASDKENINANKAFLVSDIYTEIRLMKAGDVNRDGKISIADVTALVNIILGKVTEEKNPDNFDFGAADVNCDTKRTIADVTALVNIILGKPNN